MINCRVSASLTCVGDVGGAHDPADLFHALQVRAQAAVATKDLLVNNGSDRQTVEAIGKRFPQLGAVPPLT